LLGKTTSCNHFAPCRKYQLVVALVHTQRQINGSILTEKTESISATLKNQLNSRRLSTTEHILLFVSSRRAPALTKTSTAVGVHMKVRNAQPASHKIASFKL